MLASIIVTSYNKAHLLAECLRSIAQQTVGWWECIVVDDGSSTPERALDAVKGTSDGRFKLVRLTTNSGRSVAVNIGAAHAGGKYLLFVDEDDLVEPRWLEELVDVAEAESADVVVPQALRVQGTESQRWEFYVPDGGTILVKSTLPGAGFLIRRDVFAKLGGFDQAASLKNGHMDYEFWIRVIWSGVKVCIVNKELYIIRRFVDKSQSVRSLCMRGRQNELAITEYIVRKHKLYYDRYPGAARTAMRRAAVLEACTHIERGHVRRAIAASAALLRYGCRLSDLRRLGRCLFQHVAASLSL